MFKTKLFVGAAALAMVLTVAVPASAATSAELTAQINALLAQIATLQSSVGSSTTTTGTGTTFTSDLTVGSTGTEVTALQQWLVSKGYMAAPASYGYFGTLTQTALAKYQTAEGITPASGYFGPITRAKVNGSTTTTTTTSTTSTGSTSITTTGEEGTLSVTEKNTGTESSVSEGDEDVAIFGFKVAADDSDIAIQRVKLDLSSDSTFYKKILDKVYLTVDDEVLSEKEVDSSTVTKSGGSYYLTFSDFSYVVPEGEDVQFVVKADIQDGIDSDDVTDDFTIALADDGVRGVDGAGIDQYDGNDEDINKDISVDSESEAENAKLKVSLGSSTPDDGTEVAQDGSDDDEYDELPVLVFGLKATKDDITLNDMNIVVTVNGGASGTSTAAVAHLYDGSTELDSADVNSTTGVAEFEDLDFAIDQDETASLTVKLDIEDATVAGRTYSASVATSSIAAENSDGDDVETITGSANGNDIAVVDYGPVFTMSSVDVEADRDSDDNTNSTLTATFEFTVEAIDDDIVFDSADMDDSGNFTVYRGGTSTSTSAASVSVDVDFNETDSDGTTYELSDGDTDTVTITYMLSNVGISSGLYKVNLDTIPWAIGSTDYSSTWMNGNSDWTTSSVSFP